MHSLINEQGSISQKFLQRAEFVRGSRRNESGRLTFGLPRCSFSKARIHSLELPKLILVHWRLCGKNTGMPFVCLAFSSIIKQKSVRMWHWSARACACAHACVCACPCHAMPCVCVCICMCVSQWVRVQMCALAQTPTSATISMASACSNWSFDYVIQRPSVLGKMNRHVGEPAAKKLEHHRPKSHLMSHMLPSL